MGQCTKDGGWITKQMVWEGLFMLMEMSMMVTGKMIRPMDTVYIATWMVQNMKATGKKINSMDLVLRHGQMVPNTTVNMYRARNMEKGHLPGPTDQLITVNS